MGTTVLDDSLVHSLRTRTEQLQQQLADYRAQVVDAQATAGDLQSFSDQVEAFAVAGRLQDVPVVLVTADGTDGDVVAQTRRALDLSGARLVTTITVQPRALATAAADRQALATLLDEPADSTPAALSTAAAQALASRLASPPVRATVTGPDPLGELLGAGFVTAPGLSDADLPDVGGTGQVVVVVGGGSDGADTIADRVLVPMVTALTDAGMTTAGGQGSDPSVTFVRRALDDADAPGLVTVEGLDAPVGGTALVLGIQQLLVSGAGGSFGLGDDAARVLPPPP